VQYFKRELGDRGLVIAADCSRLAPALYDADKYFIVPKLSNDTYRDMLLSICREHKVKAVFSLVDPELSFLAEHKQEFLNIGTVPIISDYETVEMCFDKYSMYKFLINHGFAAARSYVDKAAFYQDIAAGIMNYPVFIKPIKGSASLNISKATSADEVEFLCGRYNDMMIQEFMDGIEYGADVYIDMISSEIVSIFTKEKIKMRAGETDKAVSIKDEELFQLITSFVHKSGVMGIIDLDIYKVNGEYRICEVNPRFGGGYPHAYECGINVPRMILNNLSGKKNRPEIGNYEENVYMMKYNEVKIKRFT
jgi:carbamoyl-phosphate synthase large subunit